MLTEHISSRARFSGGISRPVVAGFALSLCLVATGCLSSLSKHSLALSAATTPVIDQAAAAYHSANELHDTWLDYDAGGKFDNTQTVYNPETIQPLLSEHRIDVRLTVLAAFKCYVQSLVDITNGTESPELRAASAAAGANLTHIANDLAPTVQTALGLPVATGSAIETTVAITSGNTVTTTASTSTAAAPPTFSPQVSNGVSTAADALGRYLISRKIKKELPRIIQEMDPRLEVLCKLLDSDVAILKSQEKLDYENILASQTVFLRATTTLQPEDRREQIMKLPAIVRQHRATVEQLDELHASIMRLYLTHHALVADAQGNNPESMKQKMAELSAAGGSLGQFYSSLPTH